MSRIIPAILVPDEKEFRRQVSLAAIFRPPLFQIDALDGSMLPQKSFCDAGRIGAMRLGLPFEVHLMIDNPERAVDAWIRAGAARLIIHREAKGNLGLALERILHAGRIPGMAINPETDLAELKDFAPFVHYFLVMGVHPGAQGRPLDPETAARVRVLKKTYPHIKIGVDGGVTDLTHAARDLAAAGADDLTVGSTIWRAHDPARAYREIAADAAV